jgi:hypothetical protein
VETRDNTEISEADWQFVHAVRLRGGLPRSERSDAGALLERGVVEIAHDRFVLTPAGRALHAQWARAEPGSQLSAAEAAYAKFQPLNQRLLRICYDWQMTRGGVPNDHTDPGDDWKVVDRLRELDKSARTVVLDLAGEISRFDLYPPRFSHALERVENGSRPWFASPACDSYHTVWMQLHEDLLLATGRSRSDEEG